MNNSLNARHYQANSTIQLGLANEVLALHHLNADEVILDVGCGDGDGKISAALAKQLSKGRVLGIDPSEEMIDFAKRQYPKSEYHNLAFKQSAIEQFNQLNQFSLVTAFSCLHWIKDIKQAIAHSYQALQQGGKFLGLTYPRESAYWQPFFIVLNRQPWQQYQLHSIANLLFTSDQLLELFKAQGFTVNIYEVIDGQGCYQGDQAFKDYVKGWLPCFVTMPVELQESYIEAVITEMKQHYLCSGEFLIPYKKIHCYLEKP